MSWVEAFYSALIDLPEPLTEGIYLQISLNHIQNACIVYSLRCIPRLRLLIKFLWWEVLK